MFKRNPILNLLIVFVLSTICFTPIGAQSGDATLGGIVEDQQGAAIPGAKVTITDPATGIERIVTTDNSGAFVVSLLRPSSYSLLVEGQGFKRVQLSNVILNVGDRKSVLIKLSVGDVAGTVEVRGDIPLVGSETSVGTVIDRQFAANIPLNGRSFQSLITLTPGIVLTRGSTNDTGQFSVNGQRASANSFMVDGVSANFAAAPGSFGGGNSSGNLPGLTAFGTTQSLVSVDGMQEFKVQTSGYSAEFGRQPGGQISIVTRSGTNSYHGSIFDYVRNEAFDANDWFANANGQPRPPMRQNDFGGTLGGPLVLPRFGNGGPGLYKGKDRTFFFFSYEGLRLKLPNFGFTNVPSISLRQNAPAALQPILSSYPLPNGPDLANGMAEFSSSYSDPATLDAASVRIDHALSSKVTLFGRYNWAPSQSTERQGSSNLSLFFLRDVKPKALTLGLTSVLTKRAINELRFNYSKNSGTLSLRHDDFGGAVPVEKSVLLPGQDAVGTQVRIALAFPGRTALESSAINLYDEINDQRQLNLVDNFSYTAGPHQLKFGVDYRRLTPDFVGNTYWLQLVFRSNQNVLDGIADSVFISAQTPASPIFTNFSAYAQDTWKASNRLTLDLGVRWEVNPAPTEANGLSPAIVDQIDNLATMALAPSGTPVWKTAYNNFAPRFGAAYLLSNKAGRETVIRGGIGLYYDTGNDLGAAIFNRGFPYYNSKDFSNVAYPLTPANAAPPPLPTPLTTPYPFMFAFDPEIKLPYTLQWNLAVERSLGADQTLTVSYVGAAGRRLLQSTVQDLSSINSRFSYLYVLRNDATSDYNALQASFRRRLSHGLQAMASYTWSHALDEDSQSLTDWGGTPQRGNADFDVRHIFSGAVTYEIPFSSGSSVANAIFGGWAIDSILHAQSGTPVDIIATQLINPADGSFVNVRPNVIDGVPLYIDDSGAPGGRRINSAAFSNPPDGAFGSLGRNQVRGLPAWQLDLALRREFRLRENLRLQLRAESFNVFNHPNFGRIQTSLGSATFGQATNMLNRHLGGISQLYQIGGPRSMQFAAKIIF